MWASKPASLLQKPADLLQQPPVSLWQQFLDQAGILGQQSGSSSHVANNTLNLLIWCWAIQERWSLYFKPYVWAWWPQQCWSRLIRWFLTSWAVWKVAVGILAFLCNTTCIPSDPIREAELYYDVLFCFMSQTAACDHVVPQLVNWRRHAGAVIMTPVAGWWRCGVVGRFWLRHSRSAAVTLTTCRCCLCSGSLSCWC